MTKTRPVKAPARPNLVLKGVKGQPMQMTAHYYGEVTVDGSKGVFRALIWRDSEVHEKV